MASEVTLRSIEGLRAASQPAHSVSEGRLKQLSSAVVSLGFSTPVLVDADGVIVAGHGRVEAARSLGISEIPCLSTAGMSEADKHAYFLAHHKLAIEAGWDEELLASEAFGDLEGQTTIDRVTAASFSPGGGTLGDDGESQPVTRIGDLWTLGPHRVLCGAAAERAAYELLMGGDLAALVITDPLCPAGLESAPAAGAEEPRAALARYLTSVFVQFARHSEPGSVHYICSDWRRMRPVLDAGEAVYGELANLIIWVKDGSGKGGFCGAGHELIFAFENPESAIAGQPARSKRSYRRDVWKHAGGAALHLDEAGDAVVLPTVRPVELVAEAILDSTEPGAIVLDAFCGSGTMLEAAHRTGRFGRALELDPHHCDRTVRRWQDLTGQEAVLAETGQTFADTKRMRHPAG